MTGYVLNLCVLEDCLRLLEQSGEFGGAFAEAMGKEMRIARLGSLKRGDAAFVAPLLIRYRDAWATRAAEKESDVSMFLKADGLDGKPVGEDGVYLDDKLAFVLGRLCDLAIEREPDLPYGAEGGAYIDGFLLRQLYRRGGPLQESGQSLSDRADGEAWLRALMQREIVEMHTFIPDSDDIEGWLDRIYDAQQSLDEQLALYAEAIFAPDAGKLHRYLFGTLFYDEREPLLALTERLRSGERDGVVQEEIRRALDAAPASQYARIVRRGYGYLLAADRLFRGESDAAQLERQLA